MGIYIHTYNKLTQHGGGGVWLVNCIIDRLLMTPSTRVYVARGTTCSLIKLKVVIKVSYL